MPTWAHNLGGFPDTMRTMGGMFKVRSKTATTITFDPPCPFDFSGMNPVAIAEQCHDDSGRRLRKLHDRYDRQHSWLGN